MERRMSEVIFKFDFNEEKEALKTFSQAPEMMSCLHEIAYNVLRKLDKHGYHPTEQRELTEAEHKIVAFIREEFYTILNDNGVTLE